MSTKKEDVRIYPVPEVLGKGWKIRRVKDGDPPKMNVADKIMTVPLDGDPVTLCQQMQLIGHVKWKSDCDLIDSSALYAAVEDHRIAYLLSKAGVDTSHGFLLPEEVMGRMYGFSETEHLTLRLQTDYTNISETTEKVFDGHSEKVKDAFGRVKAAIQDNPTAETAKLMAKWLETIFVVESSSAGGSGGGGKKRIMSGTGSECIPGMGKPDPTMTYEDFQEMALEDVGDDRRLQDIPKEVREHLPKELSDLAEGKEKRGKSPGVRTTFTPWGKMIIEEPARVQQAAGKNHKVWQATEEGVIPRYNHRYFIDGRVFARKHRIPGGTVIIDNSGSMSLSVEQVEAMVKAAPGCVVATYAGNHDDGVLRILAKNGRMVSKEMCARPAMGANVIDYPVLKWAFKQMPPRVWISDMCVTGIGDRSGTGNLAMCLAVARQGKFFIGKNAAEAIKILNNLRKYYKGFEE